MTDERREKGKNTITVVAWARNGGKSHQFAAISKEVYCYVCPTGVRLTNLIFERTCILIDITYKV